MTAPHAAPARTYALVVGIDEYAHGTDWRLTGAKAEAVAVAAWLVGRGVPPAQVKLFLSPPNVDQGVEKLAGISVREAASTAVHQAISDELAAVTNGELLFVYWAGHGVLTGDRQSHLFFSDATERDKRNLNFHELFRALATEYCRSFPAQVGIVNACRDFAEWHDWEIGLPAYAFPPARPRVDRRQFLLFSARLGQKATDADPADPRSFAASALAALNNTPVEIWPPDMNGVADAVRAAFAVAGDSLGQRRRVAQTPTYQVIAWDDQSAVSGAFDHPVLPARTPRPRELNDELRQRFAASLYTVPALRDADARRGLLRRIAFAGGPALTLDDDDLIDRCLAKPWGLETLVEALDVDDDAHTQLASFYGVLDDARPQPVLWADVAILKRLLAGQLMPFDVLRPDLLSELGWGSFREACRLRPRLFCLLDALAREPVVPPDRPGPLLETLAGLGSHLAPAVGAKVLGWVSDVADRLCVRLPAASAGPQRPAPPPTLVVTVRDGQSAGDEYLVQAWLRLPGGECPRLTENDFTMTAARLGDVLIDLMPLASRRLRFRTDGLRVELFLPRPLLLRGTSDWRVQVGPNRFRPAGRQYATVMRSWDRVYDAAMEVTWPAWQGQWQRRPRGVPPAAVQLCWAEDCADDDALYDALLAAGPICLSLTLPGRPVTTLDSVLDAGTPVGLWPHEPPVNASGVRAAIDALVCKVPFEDLPSEVFRTNGQCQVALMWDDPERFPPDRTSFLEVPA